MSARPNSRHRLLCLGSAFTCWSGVFSIYWGSVRTLSGTGQPGGWFLTGVALLGANLWLDTRRRRAAVGSASETVVSQTIAMTGLAAVTWVASYAAPSEHRTTALAILAGAGEGFILGYLLYLVMLGAGGNWQRSLLRMGPTLAGAGAILLLGRHAVAEYPGLFIASAVGAAVYTTVVAIVIVTVRAHQARRAGRPVNPGPAGGKAPTSHHGKHD